MNRRRLTLFVVIGVCGVLAISYLLGPYVAGFCGIGDRRGPAIYPESFHEALYIMGHESHYDQKPRLPLDMWMYRRPFFYGFPRRLKSEKERESYIEMARRNESPRLQKLIDQNDAINRANQVGAANGSQSIRSETNSTPSAGSRR